MKKISLACFSVLATIATHAFATPPPLLSTPEQDAFFDAIRSHCGSAFAGKIVEDTPASGAFANKPLVMHIRACDSAQLHIPFHVGDNASRTWILTKTGSGLSLKHDHRHEDGSADAVTMYGGHTLDEGFKQIQSFPADAVTQHLFSEQGLPQSVSNTWKVFIYSDKFSYRLERPGRAFQVDFDLTQPIETPPAPWGYED